MGQYSDEMRVEYDIAELNLRKNPYAGLMSGVEI